MPNALQKLDLEHNLDLDMKIMQVKRFTTFSVFFIDGVFYRINDDTFTSIQTHRDYKDQFVGTYDKHAERQWILDDIIHHQEQISAQQKTQRHVR